MGASDCRYHFEVYLMYLKRVLVICRLNTQPECSGRSRLDFCEHSCGMDLGAKQEGRKKSNKKVLLFLWILLSFCIVRHILINKVQISEPGNRIKIPSELGVKPGILEATAARVAPSTVDKLCQR